MTEPGKRKGSSRVKWHYLDSNRESHGGFPTEEFIEMIHSGQLNSRNYIWNGKTITNWKRIEKVVDKLIEIGVDPSKIVKGERNSRSRSSTIGANHPPPSRGTTTKPERGDELYKQISNFHDRANGAGGGHSAREAPRAQRQEEPMQARAQSARQEPMQSHHHQHQMQEPMQSHHHQHQMQEPMQSHHSMPTQQQQQYTPTTQQDQMQSHHSMQTQQQQYNQQQIQLARSMPIQQEPRTQTMPAAAVSNPQPVVHHTPSAPNNGAIQNSSPIKMEYEGVALVINSCVTYGTVMGEIVFDRANNTAMFDMNFNPVHDEAPPQHRTQLEFIWNPKTCQLVHKVADGDPMWDGTCVDIGNAFHIKNQEGIDICMIPSQNAKLDPRVTEFRSIYIGLALGMDQATFWGTYYGDITFNIPSRSIHFSMAFESSFPDTLENHRQELNMKWNLEDGEVEDDKNQFYGRCVGVGNCFHLRNGYGMDIIFLRRIPGDPEADEVYGNQLNSAQQSKAETASMKPEEPAPERMVNDTTVKSEDRSAMDVTPGEQMQSQVITTHKAEANSLGDIWLGDSFSGGIEVEEMGGARYEIQPIEMNSAVNATPMENGDNSYAADRSENSYAADRSESEGTAILRSQIMEKDENERALRMQVEELASKLNDTIRRQQDNDRQREEQIAQLNLQWTEKAENAKQQAIVDAEARFEQVRQQSEQMILGMQERMGVLESDLRAEQQEKQQITQRLEDRRKETQNLQQRMQDLEQEKLRIEAEKANMREQLEKQNLEIEQLREELSRSRANTPQREFAPVSTQRSNFSNVSLRSKTARGLMGGRSLGKKQPVLKAGGMGGRPGLSGRGFGFGGEPRQPQPAAPQPTLTVTQPQQVSSHAAEPQMQMQTPMGYNTDPGYLNGGNFNRPSKSAEPYSNRSSAHQAAANQVSRTPDITRNQAPSSMTQPNYRENPHAFISSHTPVRDAYTPSPAMHDNGRSSLSNVVPARLKSTNIHDVGYLNQGSNWRSVSRSVPKQSSQSSSVSDREKFIRSMALNIKRKRSGANVVDQPVE